MHAAIFLDRDGVIIDNCPTYIRSWNDVYIYPQALISLAKISNIPHKIIIVTNQSAVGRGIISLDIAEEINQRLISNISRAGGRIDGFYMCPHAPEDNCECRKPKPGMLLEAALEHSIDLNKSIMIGDAWTDLLAGQFAGIKRNILVRSGRGNDQLLMPVPTALKSYLLYDSLFDALADVN
jgi:D-glycero-D-manno-heptose 1,7-bisphosphate phosphatase